MNEDIDKILWVGGQGSGRKTTDLGVQVSKAFHVSEEESDDYHKKKLVGIVGASVGFGKSTFINEALKVELHTLHRGRRAGRTYQQFLNIVDATKNIKHRPIKIGVFGTEESTMYKLLMEADGFEPVLINKNPKFLNDIVGGTYELDEIFKESKLSALDEIENIVPSRADQGLRHKFNMRGGKW